MNTIIASSPVGQPRFLNPVRHACCNSIRLPRSKNTDANACFTRRTRARPTKVKVYLSSAESLSFRIASVGNVETVGRDSHGYIYRDILPFSLSFSSFSSSVISSK